MTDKPKETEMDLPLIQRDPYLQPFETVIRKRLQLTRETEKRLTQAKIPLADFAAGHEFFGLHRLPDGNWVIREWAPNATAITLIGDFNQWKPAPGFAFSKVSSSGVWELKLAGTTLKHGDLFKLIVAWPGGWAERIPSYVRRTVQDENTKIFSAQVWWPEKPYIWKNSPFKRNTDAPRIYEAHVGMAQAEPRLGTYREFEEKILPRVVEAGYNTLQLMAIQEHPYYGSFGYHVSNYFAASSRFGTPEELKSLIDAAHGAGLAVIMDLVHSHSVRNETEGLSRFDGTLTQYFHEGARGDHVAWDSRCFNYGKTEVLHFLLSNCRFWLDEYRFDGYRFDGVTSMLYYDHGLGKAFTNYGDYYDGNVDEDAVAYLALANKVIHTVRPDAMTIAEDVSGMPGLGTPLENGGIGFDFRLAMGTPDYWIKLIKEVADENWPVGNLYYELTNRRQDEKTISYAESHDQALVGDKTIIFRLIDADMYTGMSVIPREGNHWSYHYARRQWHLRDDPNLRYRFLAEFDKSMMGLCKDYKLIETPGPHFLHEHVSDQVLAFERAGLVFIFNFNPSKSFTDYSIPVRPGNYRLLVDSDAVEFGGFGRVEPWGEYGGLNSTILTYLPSRTILVLSTRTLGP
jgi:1,4-alpha-glucan branching enzyme